MIWYDKQVNWSILQLANESFDVETCCFSTLSPRLRPFSDKEHFSEKIRVWTMFAHWQQHYGECILNSEFWFRWRRWFRILNPKKKFFFSDDHNFEMKCCRVPRITANYPAEGLDIAKKVKVEQIFTEDWPTSLRGNEGKCALWRINVFVIFLCFFAFKTWFFFIFPIFYCFFTLLTHFCHRHLNPCRFPGVSLR